MAVNTVSPAVAAGSLDGEASGLDVPAMDAEILQSEIQNETNADANQMTDAEAPAAEDAAAPGTEDVVALLREEDDGDGILTPEELAGSVGMIDGVDGVSQEETTIAAEALAPTIAENYDDPLVQSAATSLEVLSLRATDDPGAQLVADLKEQEVLAMADDAASAGVIDGAAETDAANEAAAVGDATESTGATDGELTDLQQLVLEAGLEAAQMFMDVFSAMMGDTDSPYAGSSTDELLKGLDFAANMMNFVAQAAQFAFGGEGDGGFPIGGGDGVITPPPAYDPDLNGDGEISLDESVNESVYNMGQTVVNAASPNDILNGGRPL